MLMHIGLFPILWVTKLIYSESQNFMKAKSLNPKSNDRFGLNHFNENFLGMFSDKIRPCGFGFT